MANMEKKILMKFRVQYVSIISILQLGLFPTDKLISLVVLDGHHKKKEWIHFQGRLLYKNCFLFPSGKGSTLDEKNLLPLEQVLSLNLYHSLTEISLTPDLE